MRAVDLIVWHTAASGVPSAGTQFDVSAAEIDRWHREGRGWRGIGYHYLVRWDGSVEVGRPLKAVGAHVRGRNPTSVGICLSGHGDVARPTPEQEAAALALTRGLMDAFGLLPHQVVGHRELDPRRTCPGTGVSMDAVRLELSNPPVLP